MRYFTGAAKVLLALVALGGVIGVGLWELLWAVFDLNGPDLTDTAGAGLYWDVAKLWAVGAGIAALAQLGRDDAVERMAGWVAAMLLMPAWPLQAATLAVLLAQRREAGWRRLSAMAAGALLLVGGGGWAMTAYAAKQPWATGPDSALTGRWQSTHGGTLELHPDHTFTATAANPEHDWANWPGTTTGRWALPGSTPTSPRALLLTPDNGTTVELDPYGSAAPATLCVPIDWETPCDGALHRR